MNTTRKLAYKRLIEDSIESARSIASRCERELDKEVENASYAFFSYGEEINIKYDDEQGVCLALAECGRLSALAEQLEKMLEILDEIFRIEWSEVPGHKRLERYVEKLRGEIDECLRHNA